MNRTSAGESIVSEITIEAPAERIFDALVAPEQRAAWWGGGNSPFKTESVVSDLRVGGKWEMGGTTGPRPFTIGGEYLEVDRPRALAFTWFPSFAPQAAGSRVRFELIEQGEATLVRVTHSGLQPEAAGTHQGWPNLLAALRRYVTA